MNPCQLCDRPGFAATCPHCIEKATASLPKAHKARDKHETTGR